MAIIFLLAACDSSVPPAPVPPTATSGVTAANPNPTLAAAVSTATSPAADTPTTVVVTPTAAPPQTTVTDTASPPTATNTSQPTATVPSAQSTQLQPVAVSVPQQYSGFAAGSKINLPSGFSISVLAAGLHAPRMMALAPNGDLFVANMGAGQVVALPDRNQDGVADSVAVFADGLDNPHSLAFHNGYLYVATDSKVVRYPYANGDLKASAAAALVTDAIPVGTDHHSRTITFGPDGKLYIAAGSTCNVCEESDPHYAAI
ncbi:MAG: hypothetical protein DLM69_05145, partial [Candidatus Chloroheliales bacterium]